MKNKYAKRLWALVLAAALILSLCPAAYAAGGGSTVTLNKAALTLPLDGAETLTAAVSGSLAGTAVTWSSDDARVAEVDETGKVTAVGIGTANITAACVQDGGVAAVCAVTVAAPVVTFTASPVRMTVGDSAALSAKVDNAVAGGTLSYAVESMYASTVKVDGSTVTALAPGEVVVKAIYTYTLAGSTANYTVDTGCTISIHPLSAAVTPVAVDLEVGGSQSLSLSANTTSQPVVWASSNPAVATVSDKGVVTAVGPGTATITTKVGAVTVSPAVTVTVSGLVLDRTELDLFMGKSSMLVCNAFGRAVDHTLLWSSSNISVAGVKNGKVAAYNPGTAVITVSAGHYSAKCTVTVAEDVADDIPDSVRGGQVLSFEGDLISALQAAATKQIGESAVYLNGLSVDPKQGVLYYTYISAEAPGMGVGSGENFYFGNVPGEKKLAQVSFVPNPTFVGTAVITYSAYGETLSFSGKIRVEVSSSGDVAYSTTAGKQVMLVPEDFSAVCIERTGRSLRHVSFSLPKETEGTLYYDYNPLESYSLWVDKGTKYYAHGAGMQLSKITFIPAKGFSGTVAIPYTGTDSGGNTYIGTLTITVYGSDEPVTEEICYQIGAGSTAAFDPQDFYAACQRSTGSVLNYIYLEQPAASQGKLYYNYNVTGGTGAVVSEENRYFYASGSPLIARISFVPAGSFSGTVTIPYVGYALSGERFEGTVTIRVGKSSGSIDYKTYMDRPITFNGLDFNEFCQSVSGTGLNYVSFTVPSSNMGALYYNYGSSGVSRNPITSSGRYTASTLSSVTFVPKTGFSGAVTIPFSGFDNEGTAISGKVVITVEAYYLDDAVHYKTMSGGAALFSGEDFNVICKMLTGDELDYVRFSAPSYTKGRLYYNYRSASGSGVTVNSSDRFYLTAASSSARTLDKLSFVAKSGTIGTVSFGYTGMSAGGKSFSGTVEVMVTSSVAVPIRYSGSSLPIVLRVDDFEDACGQILPQELAYISFRSLPDRAQGRLMMNYYGPGTGIAVTAESRYYTMGSTGGRELCFIARAGYQGTVTLSYAGVDTAGNEVTGTVEITVSDRNLTRHFTDLSNYSWALPSVEFVYSSGIMDGAANSQFKPASTVTRAMFVGTVCRMFNFELQGSSGFSDVHLDDPYSAEILTAQALGVVNGYNGMFRPDEVITREEAIVTLVRAMKAAGIKLSSGSVALLDGYRDKGDVSSYARGDMASMIQMGVIQGDAKDKLNPQTLITRAEMAVLIHRVVTLP